MLLFQQILQLFEQFTYSAVVCFVLEISVFVNDFEIDQLHDLSELGC